jgi:hypothetical protein
LQRTKIAETTLGGVRGLLWASANGDPPRVYVFFDPLREEGASFVAGPDLRRILRKGVGVLLAPIAVTKGSVPVGEDFLAGEGALGGPGDPKLGRLMYEWVGDEAERLKEPLPKDPRDWFGPSQVLENTYRWRSVFQGEGLIPGLTILWLKVRVIKAVHGLPGREGLRALSRDLASPRPKAPKAPGLPGPGAGVGSWG